MTNRAGTKKLIFDIGANDGSDTRYYLAKGFDVVSVEADPELAALVEERSRQQVASGQLKVVSAGVSDTRGSLEFYKNSFSEWSSFDASSKATRRNTHEAFIVETVTLPDLFDRHGVPYYLKIDVEGYEARVLSRLADASDLPAFISWELNSDWADALQGLVTAGYTQFQLVRQGNGYLAPPCNPPREGLFVNIEFTNRHSGNFGKELDPRWYGPHRLKEAIHRALSEPDHATGQSGPQAWYDIHATLDGDQLGW